MARCIRDGKVAVIYSPGYGAGWSTWAYDDKVVDFLLHDQYLVELIESDRKELIEEYINNNFPDANVYISTTDLCVSWLPIGTEFRIDEYDGAESIIVNKPSYWRTA